jgi:pyruvate/oxaloacetate carboxyltransferase
MRPRTKWIIKDTVNNVFIGERWTIVRNELSAMMFETYTLANDEVKQNILPDGWHNFELMEVTYSVSHNKTRKVTDDRRRK